MNLKEIIKRALTRKAGSIEMPSGKVLQGGEPCNSYREWQSQNKYFGKQFSILGDSISTLEGYNPNGYSLFYVGEICDRTGVHDRKDTWWGKVIDYVGGELLVNNSWSGSRVTKLPGKDTLFPSGCSDERTGGLHIGSVMPDVIIVYLGTNDWAYSARIECDPSAKPFGESRCDRYDTSGDETCFAAAYWKMLEKMIDNYPNAEIYCCTLSETYMSSNPSFRFPHTYGGTHIEQYNDIIRYVARQKGCKVIDLYDAHLPYDAIDGSHPTAAGMDTLAKLMLHSLCDREGLAFLECSPIGSTRPFSENLQQQDKDDLVEKAVEVLEIGMRLFHDSGYKDENAFKLIVSALINAPLYLPVSIDLEAMLGDVDPTKLKAGDIIQTQKEVAIKILTINIQDTEFVPMFTSTEQVNKGPSVSTMRMDPQMYLQKVIEMDKDIVINPFGGMAFILNRQMMEDLLLPMVFQNS